jgi:hypothetical protein
MLHQVLSQLESFSMDLVNNNLFKLGDNGAKLTIMLVLKIVHFVARFFSNMDNHVMEGLVPKFVPNFIPCDANPKCQGAVIIAPVSNIATLKVKAKNCLLELLFASKPTKNKNSNLWLVSGTSQRLVCSVARRARQFWICSPSTSQKNIALSSFSTTKSAPSPIRLVISSILESDTRFLMTTKPKSLLIVMQLKGEKFGMMPTPLQSTVMGEMQTL